ncbi:hypothetical protein [Adhaeribacter soli]|uniref:DUF2029 domain-containing protein n=1 Tax=Adhaeribacter soli TaxID=2607655 RepID=A0A5N1J5B6_9BACT|nr:hypothetical protein [Adhaeribacter soli]KAA9345917.1 hypothetical protein F0P94_02205 [Adhaeribacter soli]
MNNLLQNRWALISGATLSGLAYYLLGYELPRQEFGKLFLLFFLAFSAYVLLSRNLNLKTGLWLGMAFRVIFLFSLPALSDDYFRFLWDGRLLTAGENPFLHLPGFYHEQNFSGIPGLNQALYAGLNSPHYFSVYPPVCQFIFALAGWLFSENNLSGIIVMRLFILAAEAGTLLLLPKLLSQLGQRKENALWYVLNPLVIVELTGNLHFEALMIFFTLAAFYFLNRNRYHLSALSLAFAVCSKLLPLILLPFLFRLLGLKNWLLYCSTVGATCLLLFLPFLNAELIAHFSNSLNLYFQKFEFNASVYYLLREIGLYLYGYNQIAFIGPLLSVITFISILALAFRSGNNDFATLPKQLLTGLTIYFLLATIVHPWYITTLVALSVLAHSRYALVWSGLAVLSYAAYQTASYTENYWLVGLEYLGVATALLLENRYRFHLKNQPVPEAV